MQEVSRAFKDRPMTPQKSIVYWTEYVIRHNGVPYLKALGSDMPFYKYFMLDIAAFAFIVLSIVVFIIYAGSRTICSLYASKRGYFISVKKNE